MRAWRRFHGEYLSPHVSTEADVFDVAAWNTCPASFVGWNARLTPTGGASRGTTWCAAPSTTPAP